MTPNELVDALDRALILARERTYAPDFGLRIGNPITELPPDAIAQLRASIRTTAETEALRAALALCDDPIAVTINESGPVARLMRAADALPEDVKTRLRGKP